MIVNYYEFNPCAALILPQVSLTLMDVVGFQLLNQVHQTFYDAYELSQALKGPSSPVTKKGKRRPSVVDEDAPLFDVKVK